MCTHQVNKSEKDRKYKLLMRMRRKWNSYKLLEECKLVHLLLEASWDHPVQLKFHTSCHSSSNSKAKRMHWSQQTPSSNYTREDSTHGHHQMVNTKIRLIIFFAAKDGEGLYSQQKQDRELTVAQIMDSLLPNSDLN